MTLQRELSVLLRWKTLIRERLPRDYPALSADLARLLDAIEEPAADHTELSDFGGLGRNCPDLEIGSDWRETPAETAGRVRRKGSVSMRELAKMPDANLKAAVEALREPKR